MPFEEYFETGYSDKKKKPIRCINIHKKIDKMKNSHLSIVLFGTLLAFFVILLQCFEYKYYVGSLDTYIYTSVVATIFTIVGVWIGFNILRPKNTTIESTQETNHLKLKELKLNTREYEILQLIAKGFSNQEIANQLFLAVPTIKTHTSNLYSKLEVRSRTQAIHKARSLKLI